jgi:hypothetical protein
VGGMPVKLGRDLQGVEGIPPRRFGDPHHHRTRQRPPGPGFDHLVQGGDAQGAQRQRSPPGRVRGAIETGQGDSSQRPHRDQQAHPLRANPARRERQHPGRSGVQPLGVIDCDHDRTLQGQVPQDRQDRSRQGPLVDPLGRRRGPEQGGRKRHSLRIGQLLEGVVAQRLEQVPDPRQRQTPIRLGRPGLKQPRTPLASPAPPLAPQGGLPDARLTLDRQDRELTASGYKKRVERRQLPAAAHDPARGDPRTSDEPG